MPIFKIQCRKIPKRFYFRAPRFNLHACSQEDWATILAFMDIDKPVHHSFYEFIEVYYKKDKNVIGTGPFPQELKQYFDHEDKQVNIDEFW